MAMKQPDDRSHFLLPDLGEGVAEAELIDWKVSPGDAVAEHQTLAEMETDKARVEVPSPWAGVVKDLNGSAGDIILVGDILVTYDIGSAADMASAPATVAAESVTEDAGTVVGNVSETLSMPSSFQRNLNLQRAKTTNVELWQPRPFAASPRTSRSTSIPSLPRVAEDASLHLM